VNRVDNLDGGHVLSPEPGGTRGDRPGLTRTQGDSPDPVARAGCFKIPPPLSPFPVKSVYGGDAL
jgi:hypothetical protein